VPIKQIIAAIEKAKKDEATERLALVKKMRNYIWIPPKSLFFKTSVGEKDLRNRIPAAFPGTGWGKIGGKNRHDLRAFGGDYTRFNSAVFWQNGW